MLQPILFIGLGGAGGKTLRAIKEQLHNDLSAKGYGVGIPSAWQFLHIDTNSYGDESFPAPMLPASEHYSVVKPGMMLKDIVNFVEKLGPPAETQKMLAGWSTKLVPIQINGPQKPNRAIGRLALVADLRNTFDVIQKAINKMLGPVALPELQGLASVLGIQTVETIPQVFIISSLGGGSGSGMFSDIAELVKRSTDSFWGNQSIALLYTPKVFESLHSMGRFIPMNSLGAMHELIAGEGTGLALSTELLYAKCGIPPRREEDKNTYGSRSNILVGSNSGEMQEIIIDFGTRFAESIVQGETSQFLLSIISDHNSQSIISSDDAGLATGESTLSPLLPGPQNLMPLWSIPSLVNSIDFEIEVRKSNVQMWDMFWEGKRARPLTESIPLDAETRRSMIAGWFIASQFGMRKIVYKHSGRSAMIWNPTLGVSGWSSFPDPLLPTHPEDMSRPFWVLPQLLLSTGIALVKFGLTGDSTFIDGYRQLNHLGCEVNSPTARIRWGRDRGTRISWKQLGESRILSDWIQSGVKPVSELELSDSLDVAHGTSVDRAHALYTSVERIRENYTQWWKELEEKQWHEMPETWELRDDIDLALIEIREYAKKFLD